MTQDWHDKHREKLAEIRAEVEIVIAERDRLKEINRELLERLSSISNKLSDDPDDYPDKQLYQMMQREVIEANLTLAYAKTEKEEK